MKSKLELLRMIAEYLNEETDRNRMLNHALKLLVENSEFDTGWIFFINNKGEHDLAAHYNLPVGLKENNFEKMFDGKCWCVNQYNRNNLKKATNIIACSRLERVFRENSDKNEAITHHATVPLISSEESFGILNVATKNIKEYDKDTLDLLESVAFQIGSALKRIELTKIEKENARIQERQRLARDLHDSINQTIFSINIMSNAGVRIAKSDEMKSTLEKIESTSKYAMNEMKALIWQLKPIGLENGLVDALKEYSELIGIDLNIDIDGFYYLPDQSEVEVFRVIQEVLNNTSKHSNVTTSDVKLLATDDLFSIMVKDKGTGFDVSTVKRQNGLTNMKERIEKLGGVLNVHSKLNEGTTIRFTIPIKRE